MKTEKTNVLTTVLFVVYLLALTWIILFKLQFSLEGWTRVRVLNLIPFQGSFDVIGVFRSAEIRNNILAFVPLGLFLCMVKGEWSFGKKLLPIVGLTLAYEITQFVLAIGRADITDILSNTLGGIIGVGVYALLYRILKGRTNRIINILALVLLICAAALVVLMLVNGRWVRIR